jgi:hypothetical protein
MISLHGPAYIDNIGGAQALNIVRRGEGTAASNNEFISLARMRVSLSISHHYPGDVAACRSYIEAALSQTQLLEADACHHLTFDSGARPYYPGGYPLVAGISRSGSKGRKRVLRGASRGICLSRIET